VRPHNPSGRPPGRQPGMDDVRPRPSRDDPDEPRVIAFRAWIKAVDRRDRLAMSQAVKALRSLDVSVALVARPVNGGGT
jgi:hypothetical protein